MAFLAHLPMLPVLLDFLAKRLLVAPLVLLLVHTCITLALLKVALLIPLLVRIVALELMKLLIRLPLPLLVK